MIGEPRGADPAALRGQALDGLDAIQASFSFKKVHENYYANASGRDLCVVIFIARLLKEKYLFPDYIIGEPRGADPAALFGQALDGLDALLQVERPEGRVTRQSQPRMNHVWPGVHLKYLWYKSSHS